MAASALVPLSLGISKPALAFNECGPLVGGSVTCPSTPGNPPSTVGNPYPGGIYFQTTTPATDLHVNLDPDVNVTFGVTTSGGNCRQRGQAELTANGAAAITANVPGLTDWLQLRTMVRVMR